VSGFTGNSRIGLAVVCTAQFVVVLDATIVITALPAIRSGLGFTARDLPWVVTAYTLVFGGLLIAGGRLADLLGSRRAFLVGLAVFGTASAGCASAWSPTALIAARALQGMGAALLSPAGLALVAATAEAGPVRRRAVGWWTAAAAGGGASGWVLGGVLTQYLGWRAVFWVNVPACLTALVAARAVLPIGERRAVRPDLTGALIATAALGLAVYGLTVRDVAPLLPAGGLLIALVVHLHKAAHPLFPLSLVLSRTAAGANLSALALTATTSAAMYLAVLFVQRDWPPAQASVLFPVFSLTVIAGSLAGPELVGRIGARHTVLAGFATIAAGTVVLMTLPEQGVPVIRLLVAFALMGGGLGAASVASTHAGTAAVEPAYKGAAAGILSSSAQIGTSFGLALVAPAAVGGTAGYRTGFAIATALTVCGFAGGLLSPGRDERLRRNLQRPPQQQATASGRAGRLSRKG
jgi:MFS family permease